MGANKVGDIFRRHLQDIFLPGSAVQRIDICVPGMLSARDFLLYDGLFLPFQTSSSSPYVERRRSVLGQTAACDINRFDPLPILVHDPLGTRERISRPCIWPHWNLTTLWFSQSRPRWLRRITVDAASRSACRLDGSIFNASAFHGPRCGCAAASELCRPWRFPVSVGHPGLCSCSLSLSGTAEGK